MLEILVIIALGAVGMMAWGYIGDRISGRAFWRAYHRAQAEDLKNYRPSMTLDEAHQARDKALRKFHRY